MQIIFKDFDHWEERMKTVICPPDERRVLAGAFQRWGSIFGCFDFMLLEGIFLKILMGYFVFFYSFWFLSFLVTAGMAAGCVTRSCSPPKAGFLMWTGLGEGLEVSLSRLWAWSACCLLVEMTCPL